jgi:hypothetical protein
MHEKIQTRITYLLDQIGKANKTEEDLLLAEELMPDANIWIDYEINIDWVVKSMEEVKEVLARFAKRGIFIRNVLKSDTKPTWFLKGKSCAIRLTPNWTREEGASCRLVQVGSRTEEVPIYKLVCGKVGEENLDVPVTSDEKVEASDREVPC